VDAFFGGGETDGLTQRLEPLAGDLPQAVEPLAVDLPRAEVDVFLGEGEAEWLSRRLVLVGDLPRANVDPFLGEGEGDSTIWRLQLFAGALDGVLAAGFAGGWTVFAGV
jgi:hypothetical protein